MHENPDLADAITSLTDELRVLRDVLDELRQEVQWLARNREQVSRVEHVTERTTEPGIAQAPLPDRKIAEGRKHQSGNQGELF